MPDRHTTPADARPEDSLDLWLDALNDPGRGGPPEPPDEIADAALIARRYHDALGMTHLAPPQRAVTERNGSMAENLTETIPVSTRRTPLSARPNHRRFVPEWLSGGLTTAVMIGLVLLLAGGGLVRQYGWPSLGDGSPDHINLLAPGTSAPDDGALTCGSPDYRPIVEGDVNEETLSALGITEAPLQVDGYTIRIPTSSGEIVELPSTWTPLGGPLWSDANLQGWSGAAVEERKERTTVRNIETGDEWEYLATFDPLMPVYVNPYLILPVTDPPSDWRIIDIDTGEERLVSKIRGEPFPVRTGISQILPDYAEPPARTDQKVLLFSRTYPTAGSGDPVPEIPGPNVLVLGESLDNARFLEDNAEALYFHQMTVSPSTEQIAYATETERRREIAIVEPTSGDRVPVGDSRFSDNALPLMFSEDGSTLIVDQPGALFSVSIGEDGATGVDVVHGRPENAPGSTFVPIAFNAHAMTVLIMFEDRHIALIDTRSGEIDDMPDITVPEPDFMRSDPMFRLAFDAQVYDVFDATTGMVRFINLETGTISDELMVLHPEADMFAAPIQPGFQMEVRYPFVAWTDAYGYLDETGTFHAISVETDEEMWSVPAPDGFSMDSDQVVSLTFSPGERCLVMNVIDAVGEHDYSGEKKPDRVTTWIAPIEPGAGWTRLDIAITGWWEVYEAPEGIILPAPEVMTPVATPQ